MRIRQIQNFGDMSTIDKIFTKKYDLVIKHKENQANIELYTKVLLFAESLGQHGYGAYKILHKILEKLQIENRGIKYLIFLKGGNNVHTNNKSNKKFNKD
jgi:hypothetical protein